MMTETPEDENVLRTVRDVLREQLASLDALGVADAAIEINAGIEILNARLGETATSEEIEALERRFLSD
ncbi:hypothetical protein [Sphingopyxis chilensis]